MTVSAGRVDVVCALALAGLTVLSRLPYRIQVLYNWDAVQLALALRDYDVVKHQPHPPGYLFHVALARAANAWLQDAAAAYTLLAAVLSGLATLAVFALARAMYDRPTALAAALLLAASPLFWFYGTVGLTYAADALGASTAACVTFRARHGGERDAWLAAGCLGVAGGFRPSVPLLLFPLWLGTALAGPRRPRTVLIGLGVFAAATSAWLVPTVWLSGGPGPFLEATRDLLETVVVPGTALGAPFGATLAVWRHLLESVLVGLGPLALGVLLLPWYRRRFGWGQRERFLVGWMLPPLLVYSLVHFGQAGYVLTFLPALVVLLARVLTAALGGRRPALAAVVALLVLASAAFFVHVRPWPRDFERARPAWRQAAEADAADWILSRTAAALREHEQVVRTLVDAIRHRHQPGETAVITELGNPRSYPWLRHAMFYLPEYPIYELRVGALPPGHYAPRQARAMRREPGRLVVLPAAVRRLVWFVDHWSPTSPRPPGLREIALPYGRYLYEVDVDDRPVAYAGYTLVPEQAHARRPAR